MNRVSSVLQTVPGILWPSLALILAKAISETIERFDPSLSTWWAYLVTMLLWGFVLLVQQLWPNTVVPEGFTMNPPPGAASIPEVQERYHAEESRLKRGKRLKQFLVG